MKILITGGAGFMGSNMIHYLLREYSDIEVVNFDKLTYAGNLENLHDIESDPHYTFIKGDISNSQDVELAVQGVDLIINYAAETHVDRSILEPRAFVDTNIVGVHSLLEAVRKFEIPRMVQISTDEVYGAVLEGEAHEGSPFEPRSPYAASKAAADHLCHSYAITFGTPVIVTHSVNFYGPHQFPEKLIPLFTCNLMENKTVPVYGDGLYVRDWLYVEDHCRAIDVILKKGKIGETYCIGGLTKDINNLSVIRKIINILGKDESVIEYVKDRPGHDRKYSIDWSKIKNELGWSPLHSFDEWLTYTINWYKENQDWCKSVKNKEYLKYYKEQYGTI